MKITRNHPTLERGFHCCDCGSHQPEFDGIQHKQVCDEIRDEIRIEQQWTSCRFCFPHLGAITLRSTMYLNELAAVCYTIADVKGWHDEPREFGTVMMLVVTEIAEAMEAWRECGDPAMDRTTGEKPEGVPSELADALIRILHACAIYGIDIKTAVETKLQYNYNRPYRHGNKNA